MAFDTGYLNPGTGCSTVTAGSGQFDRFNYNTECSYAEAQIFGSTRTSGTSFTWSAGPYGSAQVGVPISPAPTGGAFVRRRGIIQ
jgi:hypothetical protein